MNRVENIRKDENHLNHLNEDNNTEHHIIWIERITTRDSLFIAIYRFLPLRIPLPLHRYLAQPAHLT